MAETEDVLKDQAQEAEVISKPGATIRVTVAPIKPRIREAIARGLKEGRQAALPYKKPPASR